MARSSYESTVLLTGYPSFVARRMAEEILREEDDTFLYCVIKSKMSAPAEAFAQTLPLQQRQRLVMLEGDPAAMDMGLSGAEFHEVRTKIDRIFHFAGIGHLDADPKAARHRNVQGAKEAVELARASSHLRNLVHLSSTTVFGTRTGVVTEQDPPSHGPYRTPIEETRARAERIVRRAGQRLPTTVLRPSLIIGDSETGEVDRFDGPYPLILLILTSPPNASIPLPIRGDLPLNMVPVDYVIRAARVIASCPRSVGRTFHIVDPSPLSARRVFEIVARIAGRRSPRGFVPSYMARSMLRAPGIQRFVHSPRAFLEMLATNVRYESSHTTSALRGTGILCPPFESYVDQIVAHVSSRIREERRQRDDEIQHADDPLS